MLRGEFIYEFDSAFALNDPVRPGLGDPGYDPTRVAYKFEEHDAIYWGLGVEWKFKWYALNPRRYFMLIPQFSMRHVEDYPDKPDQYLQTAGGSTVSENWYTAFCTLTTQYLHDKLTPTIVFQRHLSKRGPNKD